MQESIFKDIFVGRGRFGGSEWFIFLPVFWGRRQRRLFWGKKCTPRENPGLAYGNEKKDYAACWRSGFCVMRLKGDRR